MIVATGGATGLGGGWKTRAAAGFGSSMSISSIPLRSISSTCSIVGSLAAVLRAGQSCVASGSSRSSSRAIVSSAAGPSTRATGRSRRAGSSTSARATGCSTRGSSIALIAASSIGMTIVSSAA